jgi:adenosylcobinamide kinase / adenosylcobinamide-phosphate guanylyltransferase
MIRRVRERRPGRLPAGRVLALPGQPRRGRPFRVLVLGGARSGKSFTAERLLAGRDAVDYVACGPLSSPADPDWAERVRLHQERRPAHWNTMETLDLESVLAGRAPADSLVADPKSAAADRNADDPGVPGLGSGVAGRSHVAGQESGAVGRLGTPVLVDCLSTWLAGVMDECGLWAGAADADKNLAERVDGLIDAWRATKRQVVAVSNEVGSGVIPATASGIRFRDELGVLNARIAAECEQVWLCVAGIAQRLR